MAEKPKSFEELIPYLTTNPRVRLIHYMGNKVVKDEYRTFVGLRANNLIWKNEDNNEYFLPLGCPSFASFIGFTTHFRFMKDKFSILVLNLNGSELSQFHFYYKENKSAASDNSN